MPPAWAWGRCRTPRSPPPGRPGSSHRAAAGQRRVERPQQLGRWRQRRQRQGAVHLEDLLGLPLRRRRHRVAVSGRAQPGRAERLRRAHDGQDPEPDRRTPHPRCRPAWPPDRMRPTWPRTSSRSSNAMSTPEATRVRTGADALVAALEAHGVEIVFGIPGQHALSLWEALRGSSIRPVVVRHEQAAAFAAVGYARTSDRRRRLHHQHRPRRLQRLRRHGRGRRVQPARPAHHHPGAERRRRARLDARDRRPVQRLPCRHPPSPAAAHPRRAGRRGRRGAVRDRLPSRPGHDRGDDHGADRPRRTCRGRGHASVPAGARPGRHRTRARAAGRRSGAARLRRRRRPPARRPRRRAGRGAGRARRHQLQRQGRAAARPRAARWILLRGALHPPPGRHQRRLRGPRHALLGGAHLPLGGRDPARARPGRPRPGPHRPQLPRG